MNLLFYLSMSSLCFELVYISSHIFIKNSYNKILIIKNIIIINYWYKINLNLIKNYFGSIHEDINTLTCYRESRNTFDVSKTNEGKSDMRKTIEMSKQEALALREERRQMEEVSVPNKARQEGELLHPWGENLSV